MTKESNQLLYRLNVKRNVALRSNHQKGELIAITHKGGEYKAMVKFGEGTPLEYDVDKLFEVDTAFCILNGLTKKKGFCSKARVIARFCKPLEFSVYGWSNLKDKKVPIKVEDIKRLGVLSALYVNIDGKVLSIASSVADLVVKDLAVMVVRELDGNYAVIDLGYADGCVSICL